MDFSIIIPAKNEENNIGKCLDSIFHVRYPRERFEVLVIDNGSSDRTTEIAKDKGAKVHVKPNMTISALRNFGASQSQGDVLVFLDADCTIQDDWLDNAVCYLDEEEVVCFGSPPGIPDAATWVQKAWFQIRGRQKIVEDVEWLESMNMFVRADIFAKVQGFNESLVTCEDYDLSLRLRQQGRIVADQRIRAIHHGEAATVAHFFKKELWRGTSNLQGAFSHGVSLKELPSLLLPLFYFILGIMTLVYLAYLALFADSGSFEYLGAMILIWQTPFLALAVLKSRRSFKAYLTGQLFLLLNVYFLARSIAMLRRG